MHGFFSLFGFVGLLLGFFHFDIVVDCAGALLLFHYFAASCRKIQGTYFR